MSNKKSACDTVNATSTKNNKPNSIISSATEKIKLCNKKILKTINLKQFLSRGFKKPDEIKKFEKQYAEFLEDIKNVRNNSKRTA